MKTRVLVRMTLIGTGCALALAGCGSEREADSVPAAAPAAPAASATPAPEARHGGKLIVFRRVRYEGATMNVMSLYADGFVRIRLVDDGLGPARAGAAAQRLLELETYRMMA